MRRVDIIERFDHGMAELLLHPAALGVAVFDCGNASVALLRIIISGVNHDDVRPDVAKKALRQIRNVLLGDRHDDEILVLHRFRNGDSLRAGFVRELPQRFGAARVRDRHVVP